MKPRLSGLFVVAVLLLFLVPVVKADNLTPAQKAALEQELASVEAEQKQAEQELKDAKTKSASLTNDIAVLNAKIKAAQLDIKAKNLIIQTLGNDISQKQVKINDLESHITKGRLSLADILRKTNELNDVTLPEIMLSQTSVSGFFTDIDTFDSVQQSLNTVFQELKTDQANTIAEKDALDTRRNSELDAKYAIQQEQKNIQSNEAQKKQLLTISKGDEKAYSSLIAQKQTRAAQIRAALFSLRDANPIPFGQALQYAQLASKQTGVRPALILAILTQESALGSNIGQCYVTNQQTGDGVNVKSGTFMNKVMNPRTDIPAFVTILGQIGGDVTKTKVSCPQSIGWGGAMGPAQFIPSTWLLFKDRVARSVGISGMPDPWNPAHAFMASAIYLSDLGAFSQSYSAERNAACKYYSGRACGYITGNTTYGNQVLAKADIIQRTMIDPLQGN